MSRLDSYVKENIYVGSHSYTEKEVDNFVDFWDKVSKECKPYLTEIKKNNKDMKMLLRGMNERGDFTTRRVREDRSPKDMPYEWHEAFDEWFKGEFGWNARSAGLFCTGKESIASGYNDQIYYIFPIGRYKYIWSDEISDLYTQISSGDGDKYLEPDESILSAWEDEWEEQYNDPDNENGEWDYEGTWYGENREDAIESALDTHAADERRELEDLRDVLERNDDDEMEGYEDEFRRSIKGKEYIESRVRELEEDVDNIEERIADNITWQPSMDLESYIDDARENFDPDNYSISDNMYEEAADRVCDGKYTDKNIVKGLSTYDGNEIMVGCKRYHAIDKEYYDLIIHFIWGAGTDPRQMSFDFGKKKGRR